MKKLIHTIPILILLFSCSHQNRYFINGTLSEKGTGDWVYLLNLGNIKNYVVDSALIINRKFQFKGDIDLPELYLLSYKIDNFSKELPIFLEPGRFEVKLDILDFEVGSIIEGGVFNKEYQRFLNLANKNYPVQRSESAVLGEDYLDTYLEFLKADEYKRKFSLDYIRKNPSSPISVYSLSKYKYELSHDEMGDLISQFDKVVQHMSLYITLKNEYNNQVALLDFTPAYEISNEGIKQIEIDFGDTTILHTLINQNPGKVMYIDVWGTWCGPCKAAFPELKELRNDIHSNDLVFVYLCARSMREEWEKTIAKEQLIGQHYLFGDSQLKRLRGQLSKADFLSYPTYIIINKDGRVCKKAPKPHLQKTEDLLKTLVSNPV